MGIYIQSIYKLKGDLLMRKILLLTLLCFLFCHTVPQQGKQLPVLMSGN